MKLPDVDFASGFETPHLRVRNDQKRSFLVVIVSKCFYLISSIFLIKYGVNKQMLLNFVFECGNKMSL